MQQVGQLSADGKWQWDGTKWVPANQALARPVTYPPTVFVQTAPTNSLAVVSLVSGIISWLLCPLVGAVIAVLTGHLARNQIRTSGESGAGLAMAGLVLGYIHLGFWALGLLFWIFVFGGLAFLGTLIGISGSH